MRNTEAQGTKCYRNLLSNRIGRGICGEVPMVYLTLRDARTNGRAVGPLFSEANTIPKPLGYARRTIVALTLKANAQYKIFCFVNVQSVLLPLKQIYLQSIAVSMKQPAHISANRFHQPEQL
jgi:hypothetical protein